MSKNFKIIFSVIFSLSLPLFVSADSLGQRINFSIDPNYDFSQREEISATLQRVGFNAYFYIDDSWWSYLGSQEREEVATALASLDDEFYHKIYPLLTYHFGLEWNPGIDKDFRMTILIHQMKGEAGGYFNNGDEYPRLQNPKSNEREMVYLNAYYLTLPIAKSLLAHEFVHLITFYQKEKLQDVSEEVWLNEARAEFTPTILGYDDIYEGSNLQSRVNVFLGEPSDSITEWQNKKGDYGALNLFIQYLVDHYGLGILVDSLKSKKVGIPSINEALEKNGFKKDFSQIFTDWLITVLVNDCSLDPDYCYLNKNLKNLRITPSINFLPITGKSTLSVTNVTKNWSGNWLKFIGGKGVLKFEFSSLPELNFRVPYLVQGKDGKYQLAFLILDKDQKGEIYISDFSSKNVSFIVIPSLQSKISGFNGVESVYPFSFTVSVLERTPEEEAELIQQLLAQIESLQKEIAKVQAQIDAILASRGETACKSFERDLYFGLMQDAEVSCLQKFLKTQGGTIYPEGLVTGNFLALTQTAVIRYQAQNGIIQTGYFGPLTRTIANQELSTGL